VREREMGRETENKIGTERERHRKRETEEKKWKKMSIGVCVCVRDSVPLSESICIHAHIERKGDREIDLEVTPWLLLYMGTISGGV